ncbi:DMT family transporter [Luteimonas mephitis]|uniref:DMT family transporter n=1 Tax=Luteimonas mephitis TaxID=83615 RepID=UPI003A91AE00
MTHSKTEPRALAWMLAGAAIIGTNGIMVELAGTPPTVSAFWRMAFAGTMLLGWVLASGGWHALAPRTWGWIAVTGAFFAADLWLWHRSILLVGPGLATLLGNAQVFFMALAGVLFFHERLGPRFLAGLLLAFAGLWLMLGSNWSTLPPQYRWGVWLGLGTGVCYAAYNLTLRRSQREAHVDQARSAPVAQVLGIAALVSAAFLGGAGLAEGAAFAIPSLKSLVVLLALAGVGHCLSWVLISRAMSHLRVALVGLLLLLQPVVAFVLDVWLFERATQPHEWLGLGLSLAGIFLAGLKGRSRLPEQPV